MNETKHAMIDLETLSTQQDAVVLTIGACKFNPFSFDEPTERLHFKLDTSTQVEKGRHICDDTLAWWGDQDEEIKKEAFSDNDRVDVESACDAMTEWFKDCTKIWCQGPSFDFPIIYSLFKDFDREVPWPFWLQRDSRTVTGLVAENFKNKFDFGAHNALEDAVVQSKCVQYVYKKLRITNTF